MTIPKDCPCNIGCPQAAEAAKTAVREVFAIIGIDVNNPKDVSGLQEVLRFAGKLSRLADHGALALVATVVAATLAAVGVGVTTVISHSLTGHG